MRRQLSLICFFPTQSFRFAPLNGMFPAWFSTGRILFVPPLRADPCPNVPLFPFHLLGFLLRDRCPQSEQAIHLNIFSPLLLSLHIWSLSLCLPAFPCLLLCHLFLAGWNLSPLNEAVPLHPERIFFADHNSYLLVSATTMGCLIPPPPSKFFYRYSGSPPPMSFTHFVMS